jgi:hypothetical protein
MAWHGMAWHGMAWYGMVWYGMAWYGMVWSQKVREERKLRVFENRLLRRIFGPKRDGLTVGWRKLENEELHIVY